MRLSSVSAMIAPNDRLVNEFLQRAPINVSNASKCYVPNQLACAYQNLASVLKLRAAKEIQINVCPEVLKTQQVLPIERVDRHMPFQRLRELRIMSRDEHEAVLQFPSAAAEVLSDRNRHLTLICS